MSKFLDLEGLGYYTTLVKDRYDTQIEEVKNNISLIESNNSSKNILDMSACISFTDGNLSVTQSNNGSYLFNGTTSIDTMIYSNVYTGERSFITSDQLDNVKHLPNGTYQWIGDSSITVQVIEYNTASDRDIRYNTSNNGTFTITGSKSYNYIRLLTNATSYNNKRITFMLCKSDMYQASPTVTPYAMTNVELTKATNNISIILPSKINVVVGKEISIEYYNIINCTNISNYRIDVSTTNAQIQNLGTRLRIAPTTVGTTDEVITISKNGTILAKQKFQIVAISDNKPTIKAIFLGDSMTQAGIYLAELVNMLGNNLILYGTRNTTADDSTDTSRTVSHEGRGSWSTVTYTTMSSSGGVSNPFYNNGFDFSYYITNNPTFSDVTDVFIQLGTNDMTGTGIEARYKAMCDSIKDYNENIRIHCMLPPPPAKDGYGFGTRNYFNYKVFKQYMFNTAKKIITLYNYTSGYYLTPINVNLDCWYDFPQTEVAVNSRNPQQITVLDDNVHPSKYGYYRYADVVYNDIVANCQ